MGELFKHYIGNLYDSIPASLFVWLIVVFAGTFFISVLLQGITKGVRITARIAIVEYIVLIYTSTLLSTIRTYKEVRGCELLPFWSYASIHEGRENLIAENIMNVAVFIPLGLLFALACEKFTWKHVAICGMAVSVSIEVMQYIFKRGFSEVDDVIHNSLGCMIGFGLYQLIKIVYEKISKRSVGVL